MSIKSEKFIEGDFIESTEGMIFDVKGLVQPPDRVIAFVRYFPSSEGERKRGNIRYKKVYDLEERFAFLKKNFPQYVLFDRIFDEDLIEVPREKIAVHYLPQRRLAEIQSNPDPKPLEAKTLDLVHFLTNSAHISPEKLGVSGSLLVNLASDSSDLDLIVYGEESALKVSTMLKKYFEEGKRIKRFDLDQLRNRFIERCSGSGISFDDYIFHENRKSFEGFFDGTEFFVRYIKDNSTEKYGENIYTSLGRTQISGTINDATEDIYTPCFYGLKDVRTMLGPNVTPILGIASFRGRFCQQALVGERIAASGKLERVLEKGDKSYYRLIIGNRPEDFMVTIR